MGHAFLTGQKKTAVKPIEPYQRPSEWLPIPEFQSGKDEIYVLMAIYETDFNPIAFTISGDYTVNWGDGSAEENITGGTKAQHIFDWEDISSDTYFADRDYRQVLIRIYANSGVISSIDFNARHDNVTGDYPSSTILEINGRVSSCSSLTINAEDSTISQGLLEIFSLEGTITQTDMSYMFSDCTSLQSILSLDTSNVTDMSYMFSWCYSLQTIPLLDTSNVINMEGMFSQCYSLQTIPLLDTYNVTNMSYMFNDCYSLQTIPLLNTSNVTDMSYMFSWCYSLQTIPLLNTSNVTDMSYMFSWCYSLQTIPLLDTSNVTNMSYMFNDCYSLQTIPLLNTSNVTDMSYMFSWCYSLQTIPLLNTSNVTDMSYMFSDCYSLQSVPPLDTSKVTNVSYMFYRCYFLQSISLLDFSLVLEPENIDDTFTYCFSLRNINFVQNSPKISFNIHNGQLSASELNTIFSQLATVTGKTITVTGNPGASTCNISIATSKGWTVIV